MSELRGAASPADVKALEWLLDRFEQAWQGGAPPSIKDFLPAGRPGRRRALYELIKIDLEYRWRSPAAGHGGRLAPRVAGEATRGASRPP